MRLLKDGISSLQLDFSEAQQETALAYLALLQKWNQAYNLTAITEFDKMVTHHVLDSLAIAPFVTGKNIVDVGSGAGLPGIPLAIYFPDKQFTLIDSVGKKTRFLTQAARELGLKNVTALQIRAEEYLSKNSFDTMTARAVASVDELVQISDVLLQNDGQLLMMKSEVFPEDIQKYHLQYEKLQVPGLDAQRTLLIKRK